MSKTLTPQRLESHVNNLLQARRFKDNSYNGLQIEGRSNITHIVTGVTLNEALVQAAVALDADAILVHHGLFWQGVPLLLRGVNLKRVKPLITHDISLYGYHLPLDIHETLGNNAQLATLLGFVGKPIYEGSYIFKTKLQTPMSATALEALLTQKLAQPPLYIAPSVETKRPIKRLFWGSGGSADKLSEVIALGADAFIAGEIAERHVHEARDAQVHLYAAGHHATERYGIQALGAYLAELYALKHTFIDIPSPV